MQSVHDVDFVVVVVGGVFFLDVDYEVLDVS